MTAFEYRVVQNLSGIEGAIEGYFAVGEDSTLNVASIIRCFSAMDDTENIQAEACIPIVHNEFASGVALHESLPQWVDSIPGLITFGADESGSRSFQTPASHLAILVRELAVARQGFLAPLCAIPESMPNDKWNKSSPLLDLHLKYGKVIIQDDVCTISIDEEVPALKSRY